MQKVKYTVGHKGQLSNKEREAKKKRKSEIQRDKWTLNVRLSFFPDSLSS